MIFGALFRIWGDSIKIAHLTLTADGPRIPKPNCSDFPGAFRISVHEKPARHETVASHAPAHYGPLGLDIYAGAIAAGLRDM